MLYTLLFAYITIPPLLLYFTLTNIRKHRTDPTKHLYSWLIHNLVIFLIALSFLPLLALPSLDLGVVPQYPRSLFFFLLSLFLIAVTLEAALKKRVVYFYTGGVKAAFMEEILFRGIIYGLAEALWSNTLVSIVVSSLAFGLWHAKNASWVGKRAIIQVLYTTFLAGPIFGWLRFITGDIYLSILAHLVNNIIAILSPWLQKQKLTDEDYDRGMIG